MADEIDAQRRSNRSALPHFDTFAGHRAHLTALALDRAKPGARLCVLGAGNCHDLDLAALAESYAEIHLVDVDDAALDAAWQRQREDARAKIVRHAPIDLSGLVDKLDRWAAGNVDAHEVIAHPMRFCNAIASRLPGPFDVTLSACLLTQLQLAVLNVLSDAHPLFEAVREIVTLTHLRTLVTLVAPGGRAVLASDVASNVERPLERLVLGRDVRDVFAEIVEKGDSISVADPRRLAWLTTIDPVLARATRMSPPLDVWLWQNGLDRLFLVYAVELTRFETEV
jgi:hypothetical protein